MEFEVTVKTDPSTCMSYLLKEQDKYFTKFHPYMYVAPLFPILFLPDRLSDLSILSLLQQEVKDLWHF